MGEYLDYKGKAAVFYGVGKPFELTTYRVPEPEHGAVLIRVTAANICGSDLHQWSGRARLTCPMPIVHGHEMTGRVAALGPGVSTDSGGAPLKVGDRVVYGHAYFCGRCRSCLIGNPANCLNRLPHRKHSCDEWPHFNGAYAEYYYLWPGHVILKTPDELPDEVVAGVNCALSMVVNGLQKVGLRLGESIVIQGAGGLGLFAAAVAREMGAAQVIVVDKLPDRLALARACGATETIDTQEYATPEARVARVKKLTDGWGAEVVAELAGSPAVIREGIHMLCLNGRYLAMGNINAGMTVDFDPSELIVTNKQWVSSLYWSPGILKQSLDFLMRTRGRYPFDRILSHKYPLDQINEAFAVAEQGRVIRASITP
jgi:threonine dehydrogenase-like Zn-dependent dehydrogenase